jgi:hypothetical protein
MKIFRSMGLALGLALAGLCSISAYAAEHVVLRPLGSLLTSGANTMAKFRAEVAYAIASREEVVKIDVSLQRDGNGLRQDTAFAQTVLDAVKGNKMTIRSMLS